jgi:hypothetical protein
MPPDQFGFECFEESLDSSIIKAIALAAHGYPEAQIAQPLLIIVEAILTTSVGVMKAARWRASKCHGIVQGLQSQITFQAIADGPTHNPT